MQESAFNTIALMLTVYVAALVWGIQHVSDRYGPKLLVIFFYRIALWPLIALVVLLCVAGILLLPPSLISFLTHGVLPLPFGVDDALSFILLVAAVILVIVAVYQMVASLAKGTPIISWLRKRKDQVLLLEDILLNVIQRNDVRLTHEALRVALSGQPDNRQAVIDWLKDHHTWLSTNWLARELIGVILSSPLDAKAARAYDDLLCTMLAEALDTGESAHALFILDTLCDALNKAKPWTEAHMNLLCYIGFTLWKIGEYGASAPRTAKIPEQLEELRWLFLDWVRKIWYHVLHLKDVDAVLYFTLALCRLIEHATDTKGLCESLLSRVYDVLKDGYHEHVLKEQTIQELISSLGYFRRLLLDADNEDTQTEIDEYVLASLAILAELGEKEDTLRRAASNGYIRHRITKGKWLGARKFRSEPNYYFWLSPDSYNIVRKVLGLPGLSKKQVKELLDRKALDVTYLIGPEPPTDETSHPLSEGSPATPALIKVRRIDDADLVDSDNGSSSANLPKSADQRENRDMRQ